MMKHVLVTAFQPFGGESINPSAMVLDALNDEICGARIEKLLLPVSFVNAGKLLKERLNNCAADAVICLGQAGGRASISVERVAINVADATMPDNDGFAPTDEPIVQNGPTAYFATLPIKAIVEAINAKDVPAVISNSAGTYVCNHVMYTLLDYIANHRPDMPGGFIHVPYIAEQVKDKPSTPFLELNAIICAIAEAVRCLS